LEKRGLLSSERSWKEEDEGKPIIEVSEVGKIIKWGARPIVTGEFKRSRVELGGCHQGKKAGGKGGIIFADVINFSEVGVGRE